jgi:cysteine-rich repeat protein
MHGRELLGLLLSSGALLSACGGGAGGAGVKESEQGPASDAGGVGEAGAGGSAAGEGGSAVGVGEGGAAGQGGGSGAAGGGEKAALGAPCASDGACAGGTCFSEVDRGWPSGACSARCDVAQVDCEGTGKCFDIGESQGICLQTCASGPDACRPGYACVDIDGDGARVVCVPACTEDAQCPTVGACSAPRHTCVAPETDCANGVDDDDDGLVDCEDPSCQALAVCAPGAAPTGAACAAASDCAAAGGDPICFTEAAFGFPKGYCSEFCDPSPAGCASPAAVCVVGQRPDGHGECMLACSSDADCPATGYACKDAGSGKKACQPACTADGQCTHFCDLDTGRCAAADESCADGADNDGDGRADCEDRDCAAACSATLAAACSAASVAGASSAGDTTNGGSVFSGSCTGRGGHESVYTFTPGVAGQVGALSLKLSSKVDLGVYVRSACGDIGAELGCVDAKPGGKDEHLRVPVVGGQPVAIFVDAYKSGAAGPFTLTTSFEQAICGDKKVVPPETCDDGNTTVGDGCDASCHLESH